MSGVADDGRKLTETVGTPVSADVAAEAAPVERVRATGIERAHPATAERRPGPRIRSTLAGAFAGINAIGVKELRGRMRGKRAFVILTGYLLLLAIFAWMNQLLLERQLATQLAGSAAFASPQIGRGVFTAIIMLETLLVVALAPAFTAGAISLEREKQTLDMLAATPISSLAIVLGKLLTALTYLFILVLASIPLTAIVFVFGGVAPEDVVRSYVVLLATAIGLGSIGLFCSALLKRTQAATIVTYFGVLALTGGAFFIFFFWNAMTASGLGPNQVGPLKGRPPEAINYLNPYFAQADIMCTVYGFGEWCDRIWFVTDRVPVPVAPQPGFDTGGGSLPDRPDAAPGVPVVRLPVADVIAEPFQIQRDTFWPKSVAAWLALSVVLIAGSVQLVAPTRRWRPHLPGLRRRPTKRSTS